MSTGEPIFDHVKAITESAKRLNLSTPRTVKGPCFDCDDARDDGWEYCTCRRKWSRALTKSGLKTDPNIKLEPEDLRPNVPPRMMA